MTTHGADLWEDGYPHGTVQGFLDGCRGSVCPGETDWGMSCKRAKLLAAGDYRYKKLVAEGRTPAEIAAIIDGRDTPTPEPQPQLRTPKETPAMTKPTPAPKPAPPKKPLTATPVPHIDHALADEPEAAKPETKRTAPTPATASGRTKEQLAAIRQWAWQNGVDVASHGRIPQRVLDAYDAADHPTEAELDEHAADIVAEGLNEHGLYAEPGATSYNAPAAAGNDYTDTLDEARDRAHAATREEIAEIFGVDVDDVVDPTGVLANIELTTAHAAARLAEQLYAETHPEHPLPFVEDPPPARPEWAEVAISVDVERARRIAVALEQELARTEQQLAAVTAERDQALAALELALTKWNTERINAGALRIRLELTYDDIWRTWNTCDSLVGQLITAEARTDTLVQLLRDRHDEDRDRRRTIWGRIFG